MRLRINRQIRKGSALMMVLLVVGLLFGVVMTVLSSLNRHAAKETENVHQLEASLLAHKGISYGSHPKVAKDDPLLEYLSEDGLESYSVEITPESTRIDINNVLLVKDKNLLKNLFTNWGLDSNRATSLVDALVDWVDNNNTIELNGAEREYYSEQGYDGRPYNQKFRSLGDLRLVRDFGVIEDLKPNWEDYFTVWGEAKIDLHEGDSEVLAAALMVDQDAIERFQYTVAGEDEVLGTKDDQRHQSIESAFNTLGVTGDIEIRKEIARRVQLNSQTRRIQVTAKVGNTQKEVLVIIQTKGKKLKVLHKREKTVYSNLSK